MRVLAWPAFKTRAGNPYTWLLYDGVRTLGGHVEEFSPGRLLTGSYDVWHMHWPDHLLNHSNRAKVAAKTAALAALLEVGRSRRIKIVWTVHNVRSHEAFHPVLERIFWRALVPRLDGFISPSEAGRQIALERFPKLRRIPGFVVPLGHFRGVYPDHLSRDAARARLGVPADGRVITYLGYIRPYKNVPHLIRTFRAIRDPRSHLLVAGQAALDRLADEVRAAAEGDARIRVHLGYVPESDIQLFLRAADLVALPFCEILHSASALLALSFDRPVLVPEQGALRELQEEVGSEWVRTYPGQLDRETLDAGLSWALLSSRPGRPPLERFDWQEIGRRTFAAFQEIRRG